MRGAGLAGARGGAAAGRGRGRGQHSADRGLWQVEGEVVMVEVEVVEEVMKVVEEITKVWTGCGRACRESPGWTTRCTASPCRTTSSGGRRLRGITAVNCIELQTKLRGDYTIMEMALFLLLLESAF